MNLNTQTGMRMNQETSWGVALIVYLLASIKVECPGFRLVSYLMMDSPLCLWIIKAHYFIYFYCHALSVLQSKYVVFKYSGCREINHLVHKVWLLLSLDVTKQFSSPRIFEKILRLENQTWCLAYLCLLSRSDKV